MFSRDDVHSSTDIKTMLSYLIREIWCHRKIILFLDRRETKCHLGEMPERLCWTLYQYQMDTVNTYSVARPRNLLLEGPHSHIN